jgi:opacity protein-like surface antigen
MMINKIAGIASLALIGSIAHAKTLDIQETAPQATVTETAAIKPAQKVSGFYLGMGVGNTEYDVDGRDTSGIEHDDNTLKIIAGYQFNRVFALEAQHTQYGDLSGGGESFTPTSFSVAANLGYTFSNGLRPFGVIGLANVDLGLPENDFVDAEGVGVHYGFGVEFAPVQLKGFSARLGYETDLSAIEITEQYRFGYITETYNYTLGSFYVAASYKF